MFLLATSPGEILQLTVVYKAIAERGLVEKQQHCVESGSSQLIYLDYRFPFPSLCDKVDAGTLSVCFRLPRSDRVYMIKSARAESS